jgi:hypothetical protein
VKVWDIIDDPYNPSIVMEYVEGENLAGLLKREAPLAPNRTHEILKQLCEGLQFAHEHSVIHRDIKPSNVLLMRSGTAKLTDFGLALQQGESQLTYTGSSMGSPGYVAPEQFENAKYVDHRADIFALGATCYQMLTGESPQIILLDSFSDDFKKFLRKALALKPDDRFESVALFIEELGRVVEVHRKNTSPETPKLAARVDSLFSDAPDTLKDDIFQQLLTGEAPKADQLKIWEEVLNVSGIAPSQLEKLIAFVRDHNREAIDRERKEREKLRRQQEGFRSVIEHKVQERGSSLSEEEMNHLCAVGRMYGWDSERVKQECYNVGYRLKLEEALRRGKGRLTREEYQRFLAEGTPLGWNAQRINNIIETYKHLRTVGSGVWVALKDAFSDSRPLEEDAPHSFADTGDKTLGKLHREAEEAVRKAREEEQRRVAAEQQRLAAQRRADEAVHKAREEAERRKAVERKKRSLTRIIALIGAVLGFFVAWNVVRVSSPEQQIFAGIVGTALGSVGLPIAFFLLSVAIRIIGVLLVLAAIIAAVFFVLLMIQNGGLEGALNQLTLIFQEFR